MASAQENPPCNGLVNDLNGDFVVGASDVLQLLSSYGDNYDVDQDSILDCEDACVGTYDACGVCNGPGPQVQAIASIVIVYDSVYDATTQQWASFEVGADTVLTLVCENPGCTDPAAENYDPYAEEGGICVYESFTCGGAFHAHGHGYSTVQIGDQCWFAENLRSQVYSNGDTIPSALTDGEWSATGEGATAVYGEGNSSCFDNSPDFNACDEIQSQVVYGQLYNWHAVADSRGLCPAGWHVPSDGEWTALENALGGLGHSGTEGAALKSTQGWANGSNGTDDVGFGALPAGYRDASSGNFNGTGTLAYWWSATSSGSAGGDAWTRALDTYGSGINRDDDVPALGLSIRCLQDTGLAAVEGCTDPAYVEFDSTAVVDDGSCLTPIWDCGDPIVFDGYGYATVPMGNQCWFAENLRTTAYANGDSISSGLVDGVWWTTVNGAVATYGEGSSVCYGFSPDFDACDEEASISAYGRLYNWQAVVDVRGLCPSGWHVPTREEWISLEIHVDGEIVYGGVGRALKSISGWQVGGIPGTDEVGFSGYPGGVRYPTGQFIVAGQHGTWWSSSMYFSSKAYARELSLTSTLSELTLGHTYGVSVRCLLDAQ